MIVIRADRVFDGEAVLAADVQHGGQVGTAAEIHLGRPGPGGPASAPADRPQPLVLSTPAY